MHRIVFLEPELIQNLKNDPRSDPDPELVKAVDEALLSLDPDLCRLVHERYFEGLTVREISERNHIPESEAIAGIYQAKRRLKMLLAEFVKKRWKIKVDGVCRICVHPQKEKIETILHSRKKTESWAVTCRRVEYLLGERIQPPQVLKAHMKHMN